MHFHLISILMIRTVVKNGSNLWLAKYVPNGKDKLMNCYLCFSWYNIYYYALKYIIKEFFLSQLTNENDKLVFNEHAQ